jgi:hypothetical protein
LNESRQNSIEMIDWLYLELLVEEKFRKDRKITGRIM